jgi:hypothetical protein
MCGKGTQFHVEHVTEHLRTMRSAIIHDRRLVEEGGLDIDLGELRLPVGAQILVAEALGDLVVAIKAGHHQQLLEQLR